MNIKEIINSVTRTLKQLSWRVFALLLIVSCALWLTGKLSHRYTTEIDIPLEFDADYKAEIWVQKATQKVRFMVEGDGGTLLLYKLGIGKTISVPISALIMRHQDSDDAYQYTIDEQSLIRALSNVQNDFAISMMTDTLPKAIVSPIEERKIPIVSQIRIDCVDQFMVVGSIHIVPDSISVKAPSAVLDTVNMIYTVPLNIKDCSSSQIGAVDLELSPLIVASQDMVRYEAIVDGFTERQYQLPIEVDGAPVNSLTVPHMVTVVVRIPLTEYFGQQSPRASIKAIRGEKYSHIEISGLPKLAKIVSQEPEFAQFFIIEK